MSKNNQIDLLEFPAKNPKELKILTGFFSAVFDWNYKEWGEEYADTAGSGLTSGINATNENRYTKPLPVIYSNDLAVIKEKIVESGGKIIIDTYSFPGGKRFHFTDPLGNELAVWSDK